MNTKLAAHVLMILVGGGFSVSSFLEGEPLQTALWLVFTASGVASVVSDSDRYHI